MRFAIRNAIVTARTSVEEGVCYSPSSYDDHNVLITAIRSDGDYAGLLGMVDDGRRLDPRRVAAQRGLRNRAGGISLCA